MKDQLHSPPQTIVKSGTISGTKYCAILSKFLGFDPKTEAGRKVSKLALKYFPNGDIPLQVCSKV